MENLKMYSEKMIKKLQQLVSDSKKASPWHGKSIYGERDEEGKYIPAIEICTEDIASELLKMARRSLKTAQEFLKGVRGGKWDGEGRHIRGR